MIQGSILFNIFFNEVTKLGGIKGKMILYADDLALINEHDPKEDVSNPIINDMNGHEHYTELPKSPKNDQQFQ